MLVLQLVGFKMIVNGWQIIMLIKMYHYSRKCTEKYLTIMLHKFYCYEYKYICDHNELVNPIIH